MVEPYDRFALFQVVDLDHIFCFAENPCNTFPVDSAPDGAYTSGIFFSTDVQL